MPTEIEDLKVKRRQVIENMRNLNETAEAEDRNLTSEEQQQYDRMQAEQNDLSVRAERLERQKELERSIAANVAQPRTVQGDNAASDDKVMAAFRNYIKSGQIAGKGADEFMALQSDSGEDGGYLVPPEQFVSELIKFVDDMVYMRQVATVIPVTNADSLGVPSLDTDPSDADWTTELDTGSEDTAMKFGKRHLKPHPLAKRIKISNALLRKAALNPEQLVRDRLGYKFGVSEEKAFLTGSGSNQPLGIFTASDNGITTDRDVSAGNTATSIKFDGLKEAKYTLKSQYHPSAGWMFHRDAVKQIDKLKDGEGQYIWQPSVREGQPDRLLNLPLFMSEFVPNTFTTGNYVGCLGDYSNYWIADSMQMQLQRLVELYAESNQTGFIGRMEVDGMPVLEEAFVRVKLA